MTLMVEEYLDRPSRIRELDGWRAISALLVILVHVGTSQHPRLFARLPGAIPALTYWGPLAVNIFFVISGFVICRLLISEERSSGSISLKAFYYRRACRILPPLYLYLAALAILLNVSLIKDSWQAIVVAALFLADIRHISIPHSWFIAHTWSLAIEEQFYLVFPFLFVLTPKRWRQSTCLGVFLLTILWNLSTFIRDWDWMTSSHTREGFACISCGVLIAVYEKRARGLATIVPGYAMVGVAIILFTPPFWIADLDAALYRSLFVPLAISLMLLFSVEHQSLYSRFLCCKPMQAIGATSYGIYLWQQLFTAPRVFLSDTGAVPNFSASGEVITNCLPFLLAIVPASFLLIEKPAMRLGKKLSLKEKQNQLAEVYR